MASVEEVRSRIQAHLDCSVCEVEDTSCGCGASFNCLVVSAKFAGMGRLQRHREVMNLFTEDLKGRIHSLCVSAFTEEERAA